MREITDIIIHESDTPTGRVTTVEDIDKWHVERGFHRIPSNYNPNLKAIGYHEVIYVDGTMHTGRAPEEVGAHCQNHNAHSIGICVVGCGKYNLQQWNKLKERVEYWKSKYPNAEVRGHQEYDTAIAQGKTCPGFDVQKWLADGMIPPADHLV